MKLFTLLGLFGLCAAGIAGAEPVAIVTDVSAGVFSVAGDPSGRNAKPVKVAMLAYLEPGTVIRLNPDAHLTATFLSQALEYRFTGPARLKVSQDQIMIIEGRAETHNLSQSMAMAAKGLTLAQRQSMAVAAVEMRAIPAVLELIDPVATSVIGNQLIFNWECHQPSAAYQLRLFDEQGKLVHQTTLTTPSWTPEARLLQAGKAYQWEVETVPQSGETFKARGKFSMASSEAAAAMLSLSPQTTVQFSERVLYAIYLEQNGYQYDARQLWKELSSERPDDPVLKKHTRRKMH